MTNPAPKTTILVIDDVVENIKIMANGLKSEYRVIAATNGREALKCAAADPAPDLILLDIMMPEMDGYEVCRRLKADAHTKKIPVIFISAMREEQDETQGLELGAVDYIQKPFSLPIVKARIHTHLKLKSYHDNLEEQVRSRTEELHSTLQKLQEAHEQLNTAHKWIRSSYIESIYRLTLASEYKDEDTGEHIKRVSQYAKELALALGMDQEFADIIYHAAPMHDIGKVGIPDGILLKTDKLTPAEWEIMKSHTAIGEKILDGSQSTFLIMAKAIASSHHERWDGGGYPRGLQGEEIPFAARIMNITDQYDALRSKRPYKPEFSHDKTMDILIKGDGRTLPTHFDPRVFEAFRRCAYKFNEIYESFR